MAIKILGVDFRKDSVSAVLIRGSYKGVWMDAHAHVFLDQPEDMEKGLASCLEIVSGQADISHAVCVVSLPSDQFFYRNIASPFTDPGKIDQMLPYELEQSLPVPVDDLMIDFVPVGHEMTEKKNHSQAMATDWHHIQGAFHPDTGRCDRKVAPGRISVLAEAVRC